jgi:hypothetical protein
MSGGGRDSVAIGGSLVALVLLPARPPRVSTESIEFSYAESSPW